MKGFVGKEYALSPLPPSLPIFLWLTLLPLLGYEGPWHGQVLGVPMVLAM